MYRVDTAGDCSGLPAIAKIGQAWADQLAAGVIAVCPLVELEFLYSARSLADRLVEETSAARGVRLGTDERAGIRAC